MQFAEMQDALRSVVAIPVTPFSADGQVDLAAYRQLVERLVEAGVRAITPNGNTGEFYALSPAECRSAVEATVAAAGEQALVLAGVGFDIASAIEMGRSAEQAGAHAIMIHQPIHPYQSPDGWLAYHQTIATALPRLGVVPYVRDATISGALIARLAERCLNLVGVKYAVANPLQFAGVVQAAGVERLAWVCGLAESWAPFFWVGGARGFTSGLVNVQPALSLRMLEALRAGDSADALDVWALIKPFEELRARGNNANNVPAVKAALAELGLCGAAVRPPISELSEPELAEVRAIVRAWQQAGVGGAELPNYSKEQNS
ncbi:MAG TPA: dihydrodipicolinate synthase family protein [Roseiflexaceae bacterium]|nr:dihydrodipicolinate synthase family protein [Roseiflexaceae bacterium]